MHSKELLKGTLKTILLRLLAERGRMYGYEITQHVSELSGGKIVLTEGALYPSLHKLEAQGLLKTEKVKVGRRVRKYYSLTSEGTKTSKARLAEFEDFVLTMRMILGLKTT
ncbi:MAG: PadR family transcriptional regulator [Bacteroidota bacterium]